MSNESTDVGYEAGYEQRFRKINFEMMKLDKMNLFLTVIISVTAYQINSSYNNEKESILNPFFQQCGKYQLFFPHIIFYYYSMFYCVFSSLFSVCYFFFWEQRIAPHILEHTLIL